MSKALSIVAGLLVLSGCAKAPPAHIERLAPAQLRQRLDAATARAPGVVFGAVWSDGNSLVRAAGMADLRNGRRTTQDTPFAWFSVTKLFTAAAILQLSEKGLVDLDAPAATYLPGMQLRRDGREATVRELLSHTAGVPNPVPQLLTWIHLAGEPGPTLDDMIGKRLGPNPELDFIPGTKTAYSNLGYVLLGKIVENVAKTRYQTYVETNVLPPLGCRAGGFAVTADRATAYQKKWTFMGMAMRLMVGERYVAGTVGRYSELPPFTVDGVPHGGLSGPVDCLLRFGRMTLRDGEGEHGRVLSAESARAMLTPTKLQDGSSTPFGLAWRLGTIDGEPFAMHDGGGGGYRSELRIYPRLDYAVAVLGNETSFSTGELARIIVEAPHAQVLKSGPATGP